jgi:hypothetical protein
MSLGFPPQLVRIVALRIIMYKVYSLIFINTVRWHVRYIGGRAIHHSWQLENRRVFLEKKNNNKPFTCSDGLYCEESQPFPHYVNFPGIQLIQLRVGG